MSSEQEIKILPSKIRRREAMFTHKFTGLSVGQVSELIELFGNACHHWDKVRGFASVEFESEEDYQNWRQGFEFESE